MSSHQSPDRNVTQRNQPRFVWLIPFSVSAVYLSSNYYTPHNWQFAARICALGVVLVVVISTAFHLHYEHRVPSGNRIVSRYFLITSALAIFQLVTRFLFPVMSSPEHDSSRLHSALNSLLLYPFIALCIGGFVLILFSPARRTSLALYCGLILVVTLTLSINNATSSVLRSLVRSLP